MSGYTRMAHRAPVLLLLLLAACGLLLLAGRGNAVEAASYAPNNTGTPTPTVTGTPPSATSTRTPTNTPTATSTPGCDDWYAVPNPVGGELINFYYGMASTAAGDVWAVGFRGDYGSANPRLMIEHWDGASWSLLPVDNPGILRGASALTSSDAWAVGYTDESPARTLAMHWDGSQWSVVPSPNPASSGGNYLYGVTALAHDDVWAVGKAGDQAAILHWDGSTWSTTAVPAFAYSALYSVEGAASDDVWAVGSQGYDNRYTWALHWDGSAWSVVNTPNPAGYENALQSLSVVSQDDIWAAGWSTAGGSVYSGTILHWDGTLWSVSPISGTEGAEGIKASPETTGSFQLFGIDSESSTRAWAVGWGLDFTNRKNVILKWDGSTWTRYPSPNQSSFFNESFSVTAAAPGEVWAGGSTGTGSGGVYDAQILRYGPPCGTPTPTATGTLPTATGTNTRTSTPVLPTATNTSVQPSATGTATPAPTVCGVGLEEGFESGLGQFASATGTCVPGGCGWVSAAQTPRTGSRAAFAPDMPGTSDQYLEQVGALVPSAGTTLTFWHRYNLEATFDGGVLEASTNGGATWQDMGPNIVSGGYDGTISLNFNSPIAGRQAWTGDFDAQYRQVVADLSAYAGHNLRVRFRLASDSSLGRVGWRIDDVVIGTSVCPTPTAGAATGTVTGTVTGTATTEPAASETVLVPTSTASEVPPTPEPTETAAGQATATSEATVEPTTEPTAEASPTAQACQIMFADIPAGSPFYSQVMCLSCMGMVNGYPDGTFRPNNNITRGQLAKMVSNTAGFDQAPVGETFMDVASGSTFYMYAERMVMHNVLGGYACGGPGEPCDAGNRPYFRPSANTTRGQIAKIVANAAGFSEPVSGRYYADVEEDNPFYEVIMRLADRGIVNGYACGGTNPQTRQAEPCDSLNRPYMRWGNPVTRGQAAKIVANAFYPGCSVR